MITQRRILILTPCFPPQANGLVSASWTMAKFLKEKGYRVSVSTPAIPERDRDYGVELLTFPDTPQHERKQALLDVIREDRWDLIICHSWIDGMAEALWEALPLQHGKSIVVSHGFNFHRWDRVSRFPWGLGAWIRRIPKTIRYLFAMTKFDRVVFLSEQRDLRHYFDHFVAHALGYSNLAIIPNGISDTEFQRAPSTFREKYGISEHHQLIIYIAYYCRPKDQARAARLFREARLKDTTLVFIGSEWNSYAENEKQEDARRSDRVGDILWLAGISREDTCSAMKTAQLFFMTSQIETQPIFLIEAMANGKPFICTNVGSASQMPGGLVRSTDQGLIAALQQIVHNAPLQRTLGEAGLKAYKESYSVAAAAAAYERLFDALTPRSSG